MSEKDFETQEAIQEQSPTAARFENNDLSFDELSTMIGSTFVDIANLLSGDTDISDIIQAAREISTDHDVGIGIALVGSAIRRVREFVLGVYRSLPHLQVAGCICNVDPH